MTLIASGGVVIASAALFIVLSVFAGLKNYSLEFSSFVDPDLKLIPAQGKSFTFTDNDLNELENIDGILSYSKVIEERVILKSENKNILATLKGVDGNFIMDIDGMPLNYAPGQKPDIESEYTDFGVITPCIVGLTYVT